MQLKYEFYIAAAPDRVWNAIVSPEGTKQLFEGCELQSTFEVGSPFRYVGPGPQGAETVHVYGKVLGYEPQKLFRHSCIIGDAYGADRSKYVSRVSYQLEPYGENTKLTLTHDEWTEGDPAAANTAGHWWVLLSSLKTLVETGRPLKGPVL